MTDASAGTVSLSDAPRRRLGPFEVAPVGLGCMNLSHVYQPIPTPAQGAAVLRSALDLGVDHLDTAALYGFGANEELVGATLGSRRDEYTLASKCGMTGVDGRRVIDGRPGTIRATCEAALTRLRTDVIDLYYLHRVDPAVPVEESVGAIGELVEEGKVRAVGLSEVSADTIRRAHAEHPIAAVQNEYSLWTRNPELGALDATRELGIALVAFSPLGRGVLTSTPPDVRTLPEGDLRRSMPRFTGDAYTANLALVAELAQVASSAGVALAQLALAWVLAQGEHVHVIPGTRSVAHLTEDVAAAGLTLDPDVIERAGNILNERTVTGPRYAPAAAADVDTESFPDVG